MPSTSTGGEGEGVEGEEVLVSRVETEGEGLVPRGEAAGGLAAEAAEAETQGAGGKVRESGVRGAAELWRRLRVLCGLSGSAGWQW